MTDSPWRVALGERFEQLDSGLRPYFSAPSVGGGRGTGVFTVVGTPRRWLWPALGVLSIDGILWPVWQRDVPFDFVNRLEAGILHGERSFRFPRRTRTMIDAISVRPDGSLVDNLGRHGILEVSLRTDVVAGQLELTSTRVAVRLGRLSLPVPRFVAPRVRITEAAGDGGRQRMSFSLEAPGLGKLYEYAGEFQYLGHHPEGQR